MTSDEITIIGVAVTLLGMAITIWQASQARSYKNQIKFDIRKINLSNINEGLRRAQDEIRRLPTSLQSASRGVKQKELIHKIREQFDRALGALDSTGPDAGVRTMLIEAQTKLNAYEISWDSGEPNPQHAHELQAKMQDAVSTLSSTIYQIEGKA